MAKNTTVKNQEKLKMYLEAKGQIKPAPKMKAKKK